MDHDTPLTLKELIDALTEIYKQHGDIDVRLDTQDGAWYELWSKDEIVVRTFNSGKKFVGIGESY